MAVAEFEASLDATFESMGENTPEETPAETSPTEAATETTAETPAETPSPEVEAAADSPVETTEIQEPDQPAETGEEPPDKPITTADGKKGFELPEGRYRNWEAAHNFKQDLASMFGIVPDPGKTIDPKALMDEVKLRDDALIGHLEMTDDFLSANPESQGKVVDFFLKSAENKMRSGEISTDPVIPFAQTFAERLASRNPEAYAAMMSQGMRQFLDDAYLIAAQRFSVGEKDLLYSLQHVDNLLFKTHKSEDDVKRLVTEIPAQPSLTRQPPPTNPEQAERAWSEYNSNLKTTLKSDIRKLSEEALAELKPRYAKLPTHWNSVVDSLNRQVHEALADAEWQRRAIEPELRRARMTSSERIRQEAAQAITQKQLGRAKTVIAKLLPGIRLEANQAFVNASSADHQRRAAAQGVKAPPTTGKPVKTSLVPKPDANWNPDDFGSVIDRLLPD